MLYQGDNIALRRFSIVMFVFGLSFIFVLPFSTEVLPAQFRWHNPAVNLADEHMIIAMYIALGICFLMGARDPARHSIIIDYTIISSILHGAVMFYYALALEGEMAHLWGDVPLLLLMAVGFIMYHPRRLARAGA
jgi:uncharacterized membrane protein